MSNSNHDSHNDNNSHARSITLQASGTTVVFMKSKVKCLAIDITKLI